MSLIQRTQNKTTKKVSTPQANQTTAPADHELLGAMPPSVRSRRNWIKWTVGLVVLAGVLVGIPMLKSTLIGKRVETKGEFVTERVSRGPMRISITERGEVHSLKNVTLTSHVEGTTTIIWIIPEGTIVRPPVPAKCDGEVVEIRDESKNEKVIVVRSKDGTSVEHRVPLDEYTIVLVKKGEQVKQGQFLAGDLCVQLDSSDLEEREKQQQISVTRAKADLEKAEKDVELKKTQIKSETANAELNYELAQLDLNNYLSGEYQQQIDEIEGNILIAEEELNQAKENYEFVKRVAKKGYKSQNELETARIAVVKAQNRLDIERRKLKVLKEFTHKRTLKELTARVAETKLALERAKLSGEAELAQVEAEYHARELMYQVELEKLRRYQQQIAACRMIAPQAGQVVYANQTYRRSQPVVIEEGTTVRENQDIIRLPDFTQMKVDARVHESKISHLRVGLPALIHVDAFPDQVFHGVVYSVSSVPLPGRFPNFDLREYEAVIKITDDPKQLRKLKPGLTASVEIIVKQRDDVLQVPVQAVVSVGERHFAYVLTPNGPERRMVVIGDANDTHIEIKDGLAEGEQVILNPRTRFAKELASLEAKYGKPHSAPHGAVPPIGRMKFEKGTTSKAAGGEGKWSRKRGSSGKADRKKWASQKIPPSGAKRSMPTGGKPAGVPGHYRKKTETTGAGNRW